MAEAATDVQPGVGSGSAVAVFALHAELPSTRYVSVVGQQLTDEELTIITDGLRRNRPPVTGLKLEGAGGRRAGGRGVCLKGWLAQPGVGAGAGAGLSMRPHCRLSALVA